MKNEDYRLIGQRGAAGCTSDQIEYSQEWRRAVDIYKGKLDRPWGIFGFKPRPVGRGRNSRSPQPFTPQTRFVDPALVDVITMTRLPNLSKADRRARQTAFQVLVQTGYADETGLPCVGGSLKHLNRQIDFARSPRQDRQCFIMVDHVGPLKYRGPAGRFSVHRSDLWLDLCVSFLPKSNQPLVVYRIDRAYEDESHVTVTQSGPLAEEGDVLAICDKSVRMGQACFELGNPAIDRVGGEVLCAKRAEQPFDVNIVLFKMLNRMNRCLNDMTLLPLEERPPVIEIDKWAPRIMIVLPDDVGERLTSLAGYHHTEYLKDRARLAIGPDGDYRVLARHSGRIESVEISRRQRHMRCLRIGDQIQLIPASAVLVDELDEGAEVQAGQPIADVCRRMYFTNWKEVEDFLDVDAEEKPVEFGNANWWFLPDFLQRQLIRPGQQGWMGPGTLLDVRFVPPGALRPEWRWVFDIEPCLEYLDEENGFIVCPPFYHPDWRVISLAANGMLYVFQNLTDLQHRVASVESRLNSRRKGPRYSRNSPSVVHWTPVRQ